MNSTLSLDEIYALLEREIITFVHVPGTYLSENHLSQRFGLSRTPIRSILQRLEQKGFVEIIPQKGTRVTKINLNIAEEMIYARVALESIVLRDFIRHATPVQTARVHLLYDKMEKAAEVMKDPEHFDPDRFDVDGFLSLDLNMHQYWFAVEQKLYIWNSIRNPHPDYSRFICLDMLKAQNVPDVLEEHRKMLDIIDGKKYDEIEDLLHTHLYGGFRRIGKEILGGLYKDYFVIAE